MKGYTQKMTVDKNGKQVEVEEPTTKLWIDRETPEPPTTSCRGRGLEYR